ncbi:hypothetical protein OBK27_00995 [Empedobacter falsenii]
MKYLFNIILLIIFASFFNCKSVKPIFNKEISKRKNISYSIDKNDTIIIDSSQLQINDSILTNINKYNSKIESINYFKRSKTEVKITFYKENSVLKMIRTKEESKKYDDTDKYIDYIIDKNTITDYHPYYGYQLGLALDLNKSIYDQYGLNQYLTDDFYRKFAFEIYKKINN